MSTLIKPEQISQSATAEPQLSDSPRQHRPWWHITAESIALAAVAVAGLELVLGVSGVGMEEILQPDPALGTRHVAGKQIVWRMEGFSNDKFNSQGLRDVEHSLNKPANTYRIALLGDSATEGLQVPLADTYASVLQKQLSVPGKQIETLNFGTSGYSTGQEVIQYERDVARYKPDLTILLYNRGDATENIRKPDDFKVEPRPYFYVDAKGVFHEDNAVLSANAKLFKPDPVVDFLREHSRIYGVFSHANLTLSINEPWYRKLKNWMTIKPKRPSVAGQQSAYEAQDSWKVTEALLQRLQNSCKQTGSKLVVVCFPNTVQDPEFSRQIESLTKLAEQQQFKVFDLTPTFRWHPDPMSLFVKYHFSGAGHKVVADKISEYLSKEKILEQAN